MFQTHILPINTCGCCLTFSGAQIVCVWCVFRPRCFSANKVMPRPIRNKSLKAIKSQFMLQPRDGNPKRNHPGHNSPEPPATVVYELEVKGEKPNFLSLSDDNDMEGANEVRKVAATHEIWRLSKFSPLGRCFRFISTFSRLITKQTGSKWVVISWSETFLLRLHRSDLFRLFPNRDSRGK